MSERLVPSPRSFLLTLQSTHPIRLATVACSLDKMRPGLEALLNTCHRLTPRLKSFETIPSYSIYVQGM